MNWGRETSPRPCTPRNERNLPRIRSLLHVAPTSQNDQPQQIERKLLAQTVRTDGQSLSDSLLVARLLNSYVPPRKEYCFMQKADTSKVRLVKGLTFKSKEISWQRPFSTYAALFFFIFRSRNSCINDPIRSPSSSNAKWPVSRRWSSALGISLLKSSAPCTVKIPSFLPQVISMGGCCLRKYSCQSA